MLNTSPYSSRTPAPTIPSTAQATNVTKLSLPVQTFAHKDFFDLLVEKNVDIYPTFVLFVGQTFG